MKRLKCLVLVVVAAAVGAFFGSTTFAASVQLYSWEGGLEGWTAANATLANSNSLGVTQGSQSLLIDDLTSGFKNDTGVATVGTGAVYTAWGKAGNRIALGDTDIKLEFDFTFSNASATGLPAFGQLGMFVNSTGVGFKQYGTGAFIGGNVGADFPALVGAAVTDGVTMTSIGTNSVHLAIPLGPTKSLNISAPSAGSFYQIGFKSNGGWTGSVDWAIDNMRLTGGKIPEPSSIALALGLGLLGSTFGFRRRRPGA
jgi:hypothetical protein